MILDAFAKAPYGYLVPIVGDSARYGRWEHAAFVPRPLPGSTPDGLRVATFNAVARARAAVAALDSSARRLPNPSLLRRPALRREAQSTSALEGTYAPLNDVLAADAATYDGVDALREVLNYVRAADLAFAWHADARPLTVGLLVDLHSTLVSGTPAGGDQAGRVRTIQVVIGGHPGGRIQDSRFVPAPPGPELDREVRGLIDWMAQPAPDIDPVVAAAMAHYQFETLHPFNDGNGRIGRLLVVLQLLYGGVLTEPTMTVSPWFEARRADYYDALMAVSTIGDWDRWIRFFATGLAESARDTEQRLWDLLDVQADLKNRVRAAGLRSDTATALVDFALAQPIFTVRQAQNALDISYPRANELVGQLVRAGVLRAADDAVRSRRFEAPDVIAVLVR